jgi:hypothetical protein
MSPPNQTAWIRALNTSSPDSMAGKQKKSVVGVALVYRGGLLVLERQASRRFDHETLCDRPLHGKENRGITRDPHTREYPGDLILTTLTFELFHVLGSPPSTRSPRNGSWSNSFEDDLDKDGIVMRHSPLTCPCPSTLLYADPTCS